MSHSALSTGSVALSRTRNSERDTASPADTASNEVPQTKRRIVPLVASASLLVAWIAFLCWVALTR